MSPSKPPPPAAPSGDVDAAKKGSVAREEDAPEHTALTETRLAHIVGLMLGLKFRTGSTARKLAKEWDLSEKRVRELTAEASKRVRAQINPDAVVAEVFPELLRTFHSSARDARRNRDPKMVSAVASLTGQIANIAGINAPKQTELSGPDGGPLPMIFLPEEGDE